MTNEPTQEQLARFDSAMVDFYERTKKETGYNATRFIQMVREKGGYETAKQLLSGPVNEVSEGFTQLALQHRLDLTVEALVLRDEWRSLFDAKLIRTAKQRLK